MRGVLAIAALVLGLAMITYFFRTRPRPPRPVMFEPPVAEAARDAALPPRDAATSVAAATSVTAKKQSARDAVLSTIAALDAGDRAAFTAAFVPALRSKIDDAAFAACRTRVHQVDVHPDWETAEDGIVDGHAVRRVSMFGKSMTGFHEQGGRWLADALWCVPVGLP